MISIEEIDRKTVAKLSNNSIDLLVRELMDEKLSRALENGDPDVLAAECMQSMFTGSGEPKPPRVVSHGIVAMASSVQKSGSSRHTCRLNTVKTPDDTPEIWSWEEHGTSYLFSESEEVGSIRRSIALHHAIDGLIVIQHNMKWRQERHTRESCRAWEVVQEINEDTGEHTFGIESVSWTPGHLPPPHGETDVRSHAGKLR